MLTLSLGSRPWALELPLSQDAPTRAELTQVADSHRRCRETQWFYRRQRERVSQGNVRLESRVARRLAVIIDPRHVTITGVAIDKRRSSAAGAFERAENIHQIAMEFTQYRCELDRHPHRTLPPARPRYREVQGLNASQHGGHAFERDVEIRGSNELLRECDVRQHVVAETETL